jgi:hypothetical protein
MACMRCGNIYTNESYSCYRCRASPVPLAPPQPSPLRSPRYDNIAVLEGFLLGIVAALSAASLGLAMAALAFFLAWGAFVVLFLYFPVPVTALASLAWAALAGVIAGWMSGNNWLWMAAAAVIAGLLSLAGHRRAKTVLRDTASD